MAIPVPFLKPQFFDDNGDPLAGGQLFTYLAGTTTPQTTYSDAAGTVPNTNPVVLDAAGRANVFLGSAMYKLVLEDVNGVTIWSEDNVDGTGSGGNSTVAWASHAVTDGQAAAALAGETVDGASYSAALYDAQIVRGTTVFANGTLSLQYRNSTWRLELGLFLASEDNGVTFSISQAGAVVTLKAALNSGAGDGTIKLSRRLVP